MGNLDFDSGSCTPPALSSTQSVDTLSIALLKALSDFSSSQDDGSKVAGSPTSASAGPAVRVEGAVGDDQALSPHAAADSVVTTDQKQRYFLFTCFLISFCLDKQEYWLSMDRSILKSMCDIFVLSPLT